MIANIIFGVWNALHQILLDIKIKVPCEDRVNVVLMIDSHHLELVFDACFDKLDNFYGLSKEKVNILKNRLLGERLNDEVHNVT